MVTRGTLSSTLTSKNGRSAEAPPDVLMPPSLFFIAAKLLLVALRMACNHVKPVRVCTIQAVFWTQQKHVFVVCSPKAVLSPRYGQKSCIGIAYLVHGIAVVPTEGANALLVQLQILILPWMRAC